MKTNTQATGIELTPAISDYLEKKIGMLDKLVAGDESAFCDVEVGRETEHHKSGKVYFAELNLHISGKDLLARSTEESLYEAIDSVKDQMERKLNSHKGKRMMMIRRGGAKIKEMVKRFRW